MAIVRGVHRRLAVLITFLFFAAQAWPLRLGRGRQQQQLRPASGNSLISLAVLGAELELSSAFPYLRVAPPARPVGADTAPGSFTAPLARAADGAVAAATDKVSPRMRCYACSSPTSTSPGGGTNPSPPPNTCPMQNAPPAPPPVPSSTLPPTGVGVTITYSGRIPTHVSHTIRYCPPPSSGFVTTGFGGKGHCTRPVE